MIDDDPHPEFRCRCVHRTIYAPELDSRFRLSRDPYYYRCEQRPTQEDGLCDHCRQDEGCPCCAPAAHGGEGGCRWHGSDRVLVDLREPCMLRELVTS